MNKTIIKKGNCMFFHDWTPWETTKDNHYKTDKGWPVIILEQRRHCKGCEFIEIDVQRKNGY